MTREYSIHEIQAPTAVWHQGEPYHILHCPHCNAKTDNAKLLAERGYEERTGLYLCQCGQKYTKHG